MRCSLQCKRTPSLGQVLLVVVTLGLGWLIPWLLFRNSTNSDGFLHEPVSGVFIALFAVAGAAIIKTSSVRRIDVDLLKDWNLLLFVLHLASGVALAWLASSSGTWTAYVTFSRSQWGKNTPDNTTSGFDADTCQDGNCYVTTVPCLLSQANITSSEEHHRQACMPPDAVRPSMNTAPESRVPTNRPAALAM